MIVLRPDQVQALDEVRKAWKDGVQRPAVVCPTGWGKTVVFAKLCSDLAAEGAGVLILVAREDLVHQSVERLQQVDPTLVVGVIQGSRHDVRGHVVVASVQTLSREARLAKVSPARFTHIICDEAHWARADSWMRILEHFGAFEPVHGCRIVGFTATMARTDKKGLGELWESVVFKRSTRWAIEHGFLTPVEAHTVVLPELDLAKVKKTHGDFSDGDLGKAMSQAGAAPLVAAAYLERARAANGELRPGICFTPTVETARGFLECFRAAGIPTELVIGSTPRADRARAYAATAAGTNKVLMSVGVLITGFDLPCVEVCLLARPTKSPILYTQAVGRVLRLSPGKTSALILDVVGASRLGLASMVDLGLDGIDAKPVVDDDDLDERGVIMTPKVAPEVPTEVEFMITDPFTGLRVPDPHGATRKKIMRRAKQRDQWLMTDGGTPFLAPTETYEYWTFLHHEAEGWSVGRMPKRGKAERVSSALPFPEAMWLAMQGAPVASDLDGAITEGQERFLDQLRIPRTPETTKADASRLINQRLGSRKLD